MQILGFYLQTVPVAVLFWSEIPEEYLKKSYRKCLRNSMLLLTALLPGLLVLAQICYDWNLESYQVWCNLYMVAVIIIFFVSAATKLSMEWKKILIALLLVIQYEAVIVNVNNIFIGVWNVNVHLTVPYEWQTILMLAADNLILLPLAYALMTQVVRKNMGYVQGQTLFRGCIYVIISIGVYITGSAIVGFPITFEEAVFLLGLLICNVITYVIFFSEVSLGKQQIQIEEQIQLVNTRYRLIQENIENTRRIRHDMRHQLSALRGMYEEKDWKSMGGFLRASEEQMSHLEEQGKICRYPILDSLLRYYKDYAENRGIPLQLQIHVSREYSFHIMDMTALIGNCMENALEACLQIPPEKRWIQVEIKEVGHMLLILLENSCKKQGSVKDGEYRNQSGLLSSKRQGEYGVGMKSVAIVTEKYNGMLFIRKDGERFTVKIGLEIPEKDSPAFNSRGKVKSSVYKRL